MNLETSSKEIADDLIFWLREYAQVNIDSLQIDAQGNFPPHVFLDLGNQGFFGTHISRKYGGLELKTYDILRVIEQVAAIDLTLTLILIENIQGSHTLEKYASESMKALYLHQLAAGRIFIAGAMTESEAGSNPRAMKSVALSDNGNGWLLRGSKRWVGMGSSANVIAIYVQQMDNDHNAQGMSGFLVPQGTKGLRIGAEAMMMGIRGFSKNTIFMEDIKVSSEHLLGKQGEGMEIAQDNMMFIRLCLAAAAIGAMKRCIQLMFRYAKKRMIVTGLLLDNPVTLIRLSEITAVIESIEQFIYMVAHFHDQDPHVVPEEAFVISKILGSEYLGWVVDLLVQMLGARGYEEANGISKMYRDARAFRIFEGPTEALNMYIGSRVLEKNSHLQKFIVHDLKQPQIYHDIQAAVKGVQQYAQMQKQKLFQKPLTLNYWIQDLVGEIITYGFLYASMTYRHSDSSENVSRGAEWAKQKYDAILAKAMRYSLEEQILIPVTDLQDYIAKYTHAVGDIEQNGSFGAQEVDFLLKTHEEIENEAHPIEMQFKIAPHAHPQFEIEHRDETFDDEDHAVEGGFLEQTVLNQQSFPALGAYQYFEKHVALNPHSVALVFEETQMSYAELNAKANQMAHALIAAGIVANKLVAMYFERSVEMIIGLLGIFKAGGAYLPLDYTYPEKNLKFMFEDSGAEVLLTQKKWADDIPFDVSKLIFVEDILQEESWYLENPNLRLDLNQLGYLIYTSGSTGDSKGVMLPHKALSNLIHWHQQKTGGARNVLQFTTLNFDMSFIEIFSALCSGGTLVLISEQDRLNLFQFARIVKKHDVEQLILSVPFLKSLADSQLNASYFYTLKEIIVAGEQLIITPAIASFFKQLPACRLFNYYGPAETHVVTSFEYPPAVADWIYYALIGKPISNTKILILDENKALLPPGAIGEIYIGGVAVATGYIHRSELTHEKFLPDPWSNDPEARLYRSGDFGKYLPDGNLMYLGRKDDQIKIRGFRVKLQVIELHLSQHFAVREAVVIAKKSMAHSKHLEAFIVTDQAVNEGLIDDMYTFLQERLPSHMLPSKFNFIKHMPLTNSGKINRNVLEEYESAMTYSIDSLIEPHTETEKEIVAVMEMVFKSKIGTNNSFLSIGGNSLLAMHIVTKLRDKFSLEIPAHCILSAPTIAHTAKYIDTIATMS